MRSVKIDLESLGDDSEGVDLLVALEVVVLDVVHVDGALNTAAGTGELVELASEAEDVGIFGQSLLVGLEVDDVDGVETNESGEEANVSLGDGGTSEVAGLGEDGLDLVQMIEQSVESLLVSLLRLGKSAAVDTVVDVGVDPGVQLVDLRAKGLGVQVERRVLRQVVELIVEHANDLRRLVVHDALGLLVIKDGDSVVSLVGGVSLFVNLANPLEAVDGVGELRREVPATGTEQELDRAVRDDVLETLEGADDQSTMSPRARVRDVDVVAVLLRGKLGIGLDPVAEDGIWGRRSKQQRGWVRKRGFKRRAKGNQKDSRF